MIKAIIFDFYGVLYPVNSPREQMRPNAALIQLMKRLNGHYGFGLLSNGGQGELAALDRDGVAKLFDAVVMSQAVGYFKPEAEMYRLCAQRLEVNPAQCLFVDDSPDNLEGARRVGMQTVRYRQFGEIPDELAKLAQN
jgi:putative hydrolase of the HAD superfamily